MIFVLRPNTPIKGYLLTEIANLDPRKSWDVSIEEHKSTRSQNQNRIYWKWISIIGNHVGQPREDMHRTFAIRFLEPELFVVDGKQYVGAKSTTGLTTKEFTEYLDKINATALALGLQLPTPEYFGYDWK